MSNSPEQQRPRLSPQDERLAASGGGGQQMFRCPVCQRTVDFIHYNRAVGYLRQTDIAEGLGHELPEGLSCPIAG